MTDLTLAPLAGYRPSPGPVVLCILDGVGIGRRDDGDAVFMAKTPTLDRLLAEGPRCDVAAHGKAVGLPSDEDMGNSEVGHNALGAGRVFDQGAALVNNAIADGSAFESDVWRWLTEGGTLHLLGLFSDGNVHSHVDHLHALIRRAADDGVERLRVHLLTDGRDVDARSALRWVAPLEALLSECPGDYRIASGGGRMRITMDRYEADWDMVAEGWACHVHGEGRAFASATEAIETLYEEDPKVNDQWLPAFVTEEGEPVGRIVDGDAVLFTNFRGDRALEISRAFEHREGQEVPFDRGGEAPDVRYAGMMQYDGDLKIPARFLVAPPTINRTVGQHLAAAGLRTFAVSETQKYGHVTFFFNGNRSGYLDKDLERYAEIPSDNVPFEQAPAMKASAITDAAVEAIGSGAFDHVRLNIANGDMVGHSGDFDATVEAMEVVDACVARLEAAVRAADGVMIVTADHGNANQMYEVDKATGGYKVGPDGKRQPRTSHTLNPVPVLLVDPGGRWRLREVADPGLANVGTSLLALCGLTPPEDFEPALFTPAAEGAG